MCFFVFFEKIFLCFFFNISHANYQISIILKTLIISYLYRKFSNENSDYYGTNSETLCPLCKLDHDDEESIEDRYKAKSFLLNVNSMKLKLLHSLIILQYYICLRFIM